MSPFACDGADVAAEDSKVITLVGIIKHLNNVVDHMVNPQDLDHVMLAVADSMKVRYLHAYAMLCLMPYDYAINIIGFFFCN